MRKRTEVLGVLFALIAGLALTSPLLSQPEPASYQMSYVDSSSTPTVSVTEPQIADPPLDIGEVFTVNVTIEQGADLYTWQAGLTFNASVLEALGFSEGTFLEEIGSTLWVNGTIDNTDGIIVYHASSLVGNVAGASGDGTLGVIVFKVKQYGSSILHLADVILLNSTLIQPPETTINDYSLRIKIPGDISGDDLVSVLDMYSLGHAYGSTPGSPNWNAAADINQDEIIDEADLILLGGNYGEAV